MAPFFAIEREHEEWGILNVEELRDGHHILVHNGLTVPVEVEGEQITINVKNTQGDLRKGFIVGMGDDWTFEDRENVRAVILDEISDGKDVLFIHGDEERNIPPLSIERHQSAPERRG